MKTSTGTSCRSRKKTYKIRIAATVCAAGLLLTGCSDAAETAKSVEQGKITVQLTLAAPTPEPQRVVLTVSEPTPSPTAPPSPTPEPTEAPSPEPTFTPEPTATAKPTAAPKTTKKPAATKKPKSTATPKPEKTAAPTARPTAAPEQIVIPADTPEPTQELIPDVPDTVTPELIDFFASNPKVVKYLDMPLQHINDDILRRMNRRGSRAHIERVLDHLKTSGADFTLRTTMMVGFPGETEAQFQELLDFLRAYPFDRVGAFAYSPEEGTVGAAMDGQLPEDVKAARLDALMRAQQPISRERNEARVGQTVEVLIEGTDGDGLFGRSQAEAPDVDGQIRLPYRPRVKAGQYLPVRLTAAEEYDMIGDFAE